MDLETAATRLYEDASLTEDLGDAEAQRLLAWGERQLPVILAQSADDTAFEEKFKGLRQFIKTLNRYIARRDELTPEEQAEKLTALNEAAQQLNLPLSAEQLTQLQQLHTTSAAVVDALLSWITPPTEDDHHII